MSTTAIPLVGNFNQKNVMVASMVAKLFGVPDTTIVTAVQNFKGLEHRLQKIASQGKIDFYNDSLSTAPEMTIAAIESFDKERIALIAGGYERNQDFSELAKAILRHQVVSVILLPTTGQRLWDFVVRFSKDIENAMLPEHVFVDNMGEAVSYAYKHISPHGIVLLSPASPSFGKFKDYRDRGDQFKVEVNRVISSVAIS